MLRTCLLLCLIFCYGRLFAQDVERQRVIDSAAIEYLRIAEKQSTLYYGYEQAGFMAAINHPYLNDAQYVKARLSYRQVIYPDELLRLDLSRDELIIFSPDFRNVVLYPEDVDYAEMQGRVIIYHRRDSLLGCPSSGYYILLHSEKCKVLEKKTVSLKNVAGHYAAFEYVLTTNFYLCKDDVYYSVGSRRKLLKALNPYKKELKRFISTNHLRFRKNAEEFLIRTVREYEKISESR